MPSDVELTTSFIDVNSVFKSSIQENPVCLNRLSLAHCAHYLLLTGENILEFLIYKIYANNRFSKYMTLNQIKLNIEIGIYTT